MEVPRGLFGSGGVWYIPCHAVADISGNHVTLNVDAETAKTKVWVRKPKWAPAQNNSNDRTSPPFLGL